MPDRLYCKLVPADCFLAWPSCLQCSRWADFFFFLIRAACFAGSPLQTASDKALPGYSVTPAHTYPQNLWVEWRESCVRPDGLGNLHLRQAAGTPLATGPSKP